MESRRNFIKKSFRLAGFTLLASGSTYLLLRDHPAEACNFDFICQSCKKAKECNLPEAKEHKNIK